MKALLSTLKGKIIAASLGMVVMTGVIGAIVFLLAPDDYRSIKINQLTGQTIIVSGSSNAVEAYAGMNLKSGDSAEVLEKSSMILLMDADKYMFADEGTAFKVEASGDSEKGNTRTKIILKDGSILCRLDSKLGDDEIFEVETPNSTMAVRGTIFRMSIYQDEAGENYTQLDVLEGSVKVDLYMEDGEKTGEEGIVEAGQAATVHSNPEVSEFVIGESDITYEDFSDVMAEFIVASVEEGQEICIGTSLFKHVTGLETHPEDEAITREATCALEGEKEIYCQTCEVVVRVESIEKLEHTPGEWEAKSEGNCQEKATEVTLCTECGEEVEVRELELGTHIYGEWKITKEATCEAPGVETQFCENCDDKITRTIDAIGHDFGEYEVIVAVTCTSDGKECCTCKNCGMEEMQSVKALGHSYGDWVTTTGVTCEEDGQQTKTCSRCSDAQTQVIAAIGHNHGHDHNRGNTSISEDHTTCTLSIMCENTIGDYKCEERIDYTENVVEIKYDEEYGYIIYYITECGVRIDVSS